MNNWQKRENVANVHTVKMARERERERERDRERQRETERDRERQRETDDRQMIDR